MIMNFNLNKTANVAQSIFKPMLEGNQIAEVIFDEAVAEDIKGKKDPNAVYKVLKLKFSNDKGAFEHTIFEPRENDFERVEITRQDGGTFPQPSNFELVTLLIKHTIDAIRPDVGKKIDSGEVTLGGKDWEDFRKNISTVLNKGKGVSTKIKLLENKSGNAVFPGFFGGVNQDGVAYVRNNFIGENIGFSAYEKNRIEKQKSTPTKMKDSELDEVKLSDSNTEEIDMNFDIAEL